MTEAALNGDLTRRVAMRTHEMAWQPSPSPTVERKRLHRVGSAEAGQVTSVVRYLPDSKFPAHDHPEGEEILVLDGVFSDEHGDWPTGTYLLNPEGFRHAPFSKAGCVLFVKLRQYAGEGRRHVAEPTNALPWQPGRAEGIEQKPLYMSAAFPDATRLERWSAGATGGTEAYPSGAEIFVLRGSLEDESGVYSAHSWLRLPPGARHTPRSAEGCELYLKTGGVAALRSG